MESLEVFDEYEEFELKCLHYTVLVAVSRDLSSVLDEIGKCSVELKKCSPPNLVYSLEPLRLSADSVNISRCVYFACLYC